MKLNHATINFDPLFLLLSYLLLICVKSQLKKISIFTIEKSWKKWIFIAFYDSVKNKSFWKLIDSTFSCVSFHITASYDTKKPRKSASRERTRIVLSFRVLLIALPPSSWIRSRNLRPTSSDIEEHRDAGGRCIIGSITFSYERRFSRRRCEIIGAVNNILPVRCLGDNIGLNHVSNGPTTKKDIHQRLALCAKIAMAGWDMRFNSIDESLTLTSQDLK